MKASNTLYVSVHNSQYNLVTIDMLQRWAPLYESLQCKTVCSTEQWISSAVRVASFYLHCAEFHQCDLTSRRGQDLSWSGNVSVSFGTQDQALYGTMKEGATTYLDSAVHSVMTSFIRRKIAFAICSSPLFWSNISHLKAGRQLGCMSRRVCVCGTAARFYWLELLSALISLLQQYLHLEL